MPIAKITGKGLIAIAFSVALLWACLIGDRVMVQRAQLERARVMRDVHRVQKRQRTQPVVAPAPLIHKRIRISAG